MSGLNRLEATSPLDDDRGRGQLQETLDLYANSMRQLREEMDQVTNAERIVRPYSIRENVVAAGGVTGGVDGVALGAILWTGLGGAPPGYLWCNGAAISRASFSDLFAAIGTTFGVGDGSTTFNIPDLLGRSAIGYGTNDAPNPGSITFGAKGGDTLLQNHSHGMKGHTHDYPHTHRVRDDAFGGSSGTKIIDGVTGVGANVPADPGFLNVTTQALEGNTTGGPNDNTTTSDGNGQGANYHPILGLAPYIKYLAGPSGSIQSLPISWGPINGAWELDTVGNFPISDISDINEVALINGLPQPVVRVTATGGTQPGTTAAVRVIGVSKIPFNFREWRASALTIQVRIDSVGAAGSSEIRLQMTDPVAGNAFLPNVFTETVVNSTGAFIEARLTKEDLGRDWKPGYMVRFQLDFLHPTTFTEANLDIGPLEMNWR